VGAKASAAGTELTDLHRMAGVPSQRRGDGEAGGVASAMAAE
jgi:hypothetical protein